MLNETRVLDYIKRNLGFPFMPVELEDEEILEYVKDYSLREFSYYVPEKKRIGVNLQAEANQVSGRSNEYYITEPLGLEILNVVDVHFGQGNSILLGHPPIGVVSHGELRDWALAVETSQTAKLFSNYDYTFEFLHPNMFRLSPSPVNESVVTVEYERMQNTDFSGIPNEFQLLFQDFALADIMMVIGRIRKKYGGQMRTPFGEIPLEADIFDEGKEKKREIIEKFESKHMILNTRVDFG